MLTHFSFIPLNINLCYHIVGLWYSLEDEGFREIVDILLCKDMSTCLILVLYRERNIANLFSEAKMANAKDLDITCQRMFQTESKKLKVKGSLSIEYNKPR